MPVPVAQVARMTIKGRGLAKPASKDQKRVAYRISRSHGWFMTTVAVIFDLLPLLLIIGAIMLTFSALDNTVTKALCTDNWFMRIMNYQPIKFGTPIMLVGDTMHYDLSNACDAAKVGSAGLALAFGGGFLGPWIYLFGSFIATLLAFLTFLIWFALKRVFVLNLSPKRVGANLIALVAESIPIVNILPGITMAVVLHIRATRIEDEQRHKRNMKKEALYM